MEAVGIQMSSKFWRWGAAGGGGGGLDIWRTFASLEVLYFEIGPRCIRDVSVISNEGFFVFRHLEATGLFGGCRNTNVLQILAEGVSWRRGWGFDVWRTFASLQAICFELLSWP